MSKKFSMFLLMLLTFSLFMVFNVSALTCYGNSTDEGGCQWGGTVTQTEDLQMTGSIDGVGTWDCNGYKLTIMNGQSLFVTNGVNERNGRVKNCEITSDSSDGTVWSVSAPSTDGSTYNHYIVDSVIYDVNTVMSASAGSHAFESFYVDDVGVANSTIYDIVGYVIVSNSALSQDGVRGMKLMGNNISNSNIGVGRGTQDVYYCDSQGFSSWYVIGNTFTNMGTAGVYNRRGCSPTYIEDNVFDGANSGILSLMSSVRNSGNTFLNGALGQNGCFEPPVYGFTVTVSTNDIPICDGDWYQSSVMYAEHNSKIYPQTTNGVNLINSGAGNSINAENHQAGSTSDNVEITGLHFYNFSNSVYAVVNCYNHAYDWISDTMSNWNVNGNKFYGDLEVLTTQSGIYFSQDDYQYCSVSGLTLRDNEFYNLSRGISLVELDSDASSRNRQVFSNVEISFSDFVNNTYGIYESAVQYSDAIVVFNSFTNTDNYVLHSGFDWFGNIPYGTSYIQDQNDCQYPDLLKYYDRDVTLCSGDYIMDGDSPAIYPYSNVDIFCDGTVMHDNVLHSNPAVIMNTYWVGNGAPYQKPSNVYNIEIAGCTFDDFQMGIELIGSNQGGAGYNNYIHDNTFTDLQYGIYHTNNGDYTSTGYGWDVIDNTFRNISVAGITLQSVRSSSQYGMTMRDWDIIGNNFTLNEKGIYVVGSEYSTTYCGNNPYNILIEGNYFDNNQWHVDIHHPDPVQCPTFPKNITGHDNILTRDFGAFAVKNTNGEDQDWTYNNWGTGFTGVIDVGIFDSNDNPTYGTVDYIPISGYTLVFGTPIAVTETWETAVSTDTDNVFDLPVTYQGTGYSGSYTFVADEQWYLARSTSNANGNVYISNDAYCLNTKCYKADVGSLSINPQYTRLTHFFTRGIDLQDDTIFEFSLNYQSEYWQSGGAMILRNAEDDIVLQVDFGLTNESQYATSVGSGGCSIQAITGQQKEGLQLNDDQWTDYSFTASDIESACPQYSTISNAQYIDRVEFVFGGTKLGVIGNIVWYIDAINIENVEFNAYPPNEPPQGSVILWKEEFGQSGNFNFYNAQCYQDTAMESYTEWLSLQKWQNGDHDWACWVNTSTVAFSWQSEYNDVFVSSPVGIRNTVNTALDSGVSSFTTIGFPPQDEALQIYPTDHILFTCSMPDFGDSQRAYNYLMFGEQNVDLAGDFTGMISLINGGCAYKDSLGYGDQIACCELSQIAGMDCDSERATIDFAQQDVDDNCIAEGLADLQFSHILRWDLVSFAPYPVTTYGNSYYFDDLYVYSTGIIGNNSLPNFVLLSAIPNPANVSELVKWGWNVFDPDDPIGETYTAFDCEDDGVLDYGWALRGNLGSGATAFDCTYATEGTKTGRLWFTDVFHYPTYNASATDTVDILLVQEEPSQAPPQGGTCIGFTAPTCLSESCWFYDNFNYDYMIQCNGWDGSGDAEKYHPVNNQFKILDFDLYEDSLEYIGDRITTDQYITFDVLFDLYINWVDGDGVVQVYLRDNQESKYSMHFLVNNYQMKALDYDSSINLLTVSPATWHTVKANVNLGTDVITWWVDDDLKGTTGFYDSGTIDAFNELNLYVSDEKGEVRFDNVKVVFQQSNPNATQEEEQVDYTYQAGMFCAINWTAPTGERFSEANCEDRGFSTEYPLVGLCIPRACFQDVGLMMVSWATNNIFTTIIVVTAFILIAPLLVALAKKFR